ncbi:MAG: hypothetical protein HY519_02020 [Candidatus Aenigmarchaeota archaeon]|nr:hypothetical protein [Candidatus Aenigmarchaeota archaeon]
MRPYSIPMDVELSDGSLKTLSIYMDEETERLDKLYDTNIMTNMPDTGSLALDDRLRVLLGFALYKKFFVGLEETAIAELGKQQLADIPDEYRREYLRFATYDGKNIVFPSEAAVKYSFRRNTNAQADILPDQPEIEQPGRPN